MRRWWAATATLGAVLVVTAASVWAQGSTVVQVHRVDEAHFQVQPDGPVFVLALGIDGRPGIDGDRADAIHLVGVNPAAGAATILDIPRDTYVEVPGHGSRKINDAFYFGGPALQANVVARLTGVPVGYVLTTNFGGFESMVNELGGVDVDVPFPMRDAFSGANFPQGRVRMDGRAALAFSRNRQVPGGDLRRTLHQGQLIVAALAKLRAEQPGATGALRSLAVLGRHTRLHGVGLGELYRLGRLGLSIDPARVRNVVMPASIGKAGAADVVFPTRAAGPLFADLRDDAVLQSH